MQMRSDFAPAVVCKLRQPCNRQFIIDDGLIDQIRWTDIIAIAKLLKSL